MKRPPYGPNTVVARLRQPFPADGMQTVIRGLEKVYGKGLVAIAPVREEDAEWLVISTPPPPGERPALPDLPEHQHGPGCGHPCTPSQRNCDDCKAAAP